MRECCFKHVPARMHVKEVASGTPGSTKVVHILQGRWYITAGLNPLFDTFDCQVHYFGVPEPGKLYGKINWRIPKANKDFIERSTVQTFDQACLSSAKSTLPSCPCDMQVISIYARYFRHVCASKRRDCPDISPCCFLVGLTHACILWSSRNLCMHAHSSVSSSLFLCFLNVSFGIARHLPIIELCVLSLPLLYSSWKRLELC